MIKAMCPQCGTVRDQSVRTEVRDRKTGNVIHFLYPNGCAVKTAVTYGVMCGNHKCAFYGKMRFKGDGICPTVDALEFLIRWWDAHEYYGTKVSLEATIWRTPLREIIQSIFS